MLRKRCSLTFKRKKSLVDEVLNQISCYVPKFTRHHVNFLSALVELRRALAACYVPSDRSFRLSHAVLRTTLRVLLTSGNQKKLIFSPYKTLNFEV